MSMALSVTEILDSDPRFVAAIRSLRHSIEQKCVDSPHTLWAESCTIGQEPQIHKQVPMFHLGLLSIHKSLNA